MKQQQRVFVLWDFCGKLAFAKFEKTGGSNHRIINFVKGNGVGINDQFLLTLY